MAYLHGTYGAFDKSIGLVPVATDTIPVYVGVAPVNLVRGYEEMGNVNGPLQVKNMEGAQRLFGYSGDWESFSLCEVFAAHFQNEISNVSPIVVINVLDPATHKKTGEPTTQELTFVNGTAVIESDTIILDTLVLADKVEGTDFTVDYDFTKGQAILKSIAEEPLTTVNATFSEVDVSMVQEADVVGGVTAEGVYTGLGSVALVYPELGLIPNLLAAPGYSEKPTVYRAMIQAAAKINGHWDAMVLADIPLESNDTIQKAVKWKKENGYTSERAKVCYPQWQTKDGAVYHLSTWTAWLMCLVDATHQGVPMETPSNKQIPAGKQFFGKSSKHKGFDQQTANELNENGITTAVYWGGVHVLWGGHTAAYQYGLVTDARAIFDVSIRMMMHVTNDFQREHALTIDCPMTKAMADTIKNREQEKLDALVAIGALIGEPVCEFKESENSTEQLMEGDFVWSNKMTPTPPFKSGTMKVAYTDEGFSTYFSE